MSFEIAAQSIVFAALSAALTCPVHDATPGLPEGQPDNAFPYAVVGDDTLVAWDTDDSLGASVTVTIHFWSRKAGRKEIKTLMGLAYTALNRVRPTITGFRVVDCLWEFATTPPVEADGKTRHGVQRFRLTLQKTE